MKEEDKLKQRYGTDTGYRVPDQYFDTVFAKISSELPEYPQAPTVKSLSKWQRVKPYVYMAAMFGGIWCTMKMVSMINNSNNNTPVSLDNPPEMVAQAMASPEVLAQVYSEPSMVVMESDEDYTTSTIDDNTGESTVKADEIISDDNIPADDGFAEIINVEDIDLGQLQAALDSDDDDYYYYI